MENQEQQNLALITEMIQTARHQFNERGTVYLLWGWLVFIASIAQYLLIKFNVAEHSLVWLLMPLGALAQVFIMKKESKDQVKTYLDKVMGKVWTAVGISIGLVLLLTRDITHTFPMLLVLYGIGTYITGRVLKFPQLVFGAICCWCIAIVASFVSFDYQLLLLATAMLVAYIIPGYAMSAKYKSMHTRNV